LTGGAQPPLVIALNLEQALNAVATSGWQVAAIVRTAPRGQPGRARDVPPGPPRVIKQAVVGPRRMTLVIAPSVGLPTPA
jgi:hypothetical protein